MTGKPGSAGKPTKAGVARANPPADEGFDAIVQLIDAARQRAYQAVNTALMSCTGRSASTSAASSRRPSGARAWSIGWPRTSRAPSQACADSRGPTCSACGSSTRSTQRQTRESQRC